MKLVSSTVLVASCVLLVMLPSSFLGGPAGVVEGAVAISREDGSQEDRFLLRGGKETVGGEDGDDESENETYGIGELVEDGKVDSEKEEDTMVTSSSRGGGGSDFCNVGSTIWSYMNNLVGLVPVYGGAISAVSSAIQDLAQLLGGCSTSAHDLISTMEHIAQTVVQEHAIQELQEVLERLLQYIPDGDNPYITYDEFNQYIGVVKTDIEGQAMTIGFEAIQLYMSGMAIKLACRNARLTIVVNELQELLDNGGDQNAIQEAQRIVEQATEEISDSARESLDDLHRFEQSLTDHLNQYTAHCTHRWIDVTERNGGCVRHCWVENHLGTEIERDFWVDQNDYCEKNSALHNLNYDPVYESNPSGGGQDLLKRVKMEIYSKVFTSEYYQTKLDVQRIQHKYGTLTETTSDDITYNIPTAPYLQVSWGGSSVFDESRNQYIDPRFAFYGDFNNNGKMDVIFQNNLNSQTFNDPAWYIAYDGATTFTDDKVQVLPNLHGIMKVDLDVGDFNGDGILDIFYTKRINYQRYDYRWKYSSHGGTKPFQDMSITSYIDASNEMLQLGDFNGDGKTDAFVTWGDNKWRVSYGCDSRWTEINNSAFLLNVLQFGDFNGDGTTDVFTTDFYKSNTWGVSWNGSSSFQIINESTIKEVLLGDFNGDGQTDVITGSWGERDNKWHISYSATSDWKILNDSRFRTYQLMVYDLDGDGKDDIIVKPELGHCTTGNTAFNCFVNNLLP